VAQNAYFAGKLIVENGSVVATDRLGSLRANSNPDSSNVKYFPYGAEQTATSEGVTKFATYTRDAVGQDYAEQRYYNAGMGRFWSPDRAAGNTGNPGTLNRYAYVLGDPVNLSDPSGTDPNCGPGMSWDGEGCTYGATLNGSAGYAQAGAPCGSDWMTNAQEAGPCQAQAPCGGGGSAFGLFDPTPDPGCDVPESPEPAPAPVKCGYTDDTLGKQGFGTYPIGGYGYYAPIYFNFTASGGDGVYQWADTQRILVSGTLLYKGSSIPVTVGPEFRYESLTNYGTPLSTTPVGSGNLPTASFFDAPGQPSKDAIGQVVAAFVTWSASLTVQVDGVPCGSVNWSATLTWQRGKKPQIAFGAITYNAVGGQ
jgi:RHS repeat-associated protein